MEKQSRPTSAAKLVHKRSLFTTPRAWNSMSDESRSVGGAYAKIEAHEDLCAVRYGAIESTLKDLKEGQKAHSKAAWGIVLALLGWMGVQLWNGSSHVAQAAPLAVSK